MANPAVVVDFVANTKDLQAGFRTAGSGAGGFSSKLKGLAKAGVAGAAAAGVAGLTAAIKTGIGEYKDAAKVTAQTQAVIKSTGKAAGVSAKDVESLAGALMRKSGVDDEAIQSGENLLLTFTNIKNEAGKGNKVFDQATKATLDLSVALGKDMASSATMVGKALNDPVKGMTALSRVGVSFTDAQKEQVKHLQASGKTMEAQKVILAELNKEYGGSAEAVGKTLPGQLAVVRQAFNNLTGQIVGAVIPVLTRMIGWLRDHWPEISAALAAAWATISPLLKAIGDLALSVAKLIKDNWSTIGPILQHVAAVFKAAVGVIVAAVKVVTAILRGDWAGAWTAAKNLVASMARFIVADVTALASVVKAVLTAAWTVIRNATSAAWGAVLDRIRDTIANIRQALNSLAAWVSGFAHGALAAAVNAVKSVFGTIDNAAASAVAGVRNAFNNMMEWLWDLVGRVRGVASSIASALKAPINAVISAWNALTIPGVRIPIPSIRIPGTKKRLGGGSVGFGPFAFPDLPHLATGGVVSSPTLALVGEGAGREIVAPEGLLRQIMGEHAVQVRVFIGDTELTSLVRTEIVNANTGIARALLAG